MPLDDRSWRLLQALQADARAPLKVLAEATGLSVPATQERLRKLEEAGVVTGYTATVDVHAAGYGVQAMVGIHVPQPGKKAFLAHLETLPRVLECHHVSGSDSYLMRVVAQDLPDLERFLADVNAWGETRTSIVFSTPIPRRALHPIL